VNGTRFEPKKPKRLFKEPKTEKIRRLAKILFKKPTIEDLRLENKLYINNIMLANKKPCDHTTRIGKTKIKFVNVSVKKLGNKEYLIETCAKCGALLGISVKKAREVKKHGN